MHGQKQNFGIVTFLCILLIAAYIPKDSIPSLEQQNSDAHSSTFIVYQSASDGKRWYSEKVGPGQFDLIGSTNSGEIILLDGWTLYRNSSQSWATQSITPPSGASLPTDMHVNSVIDISADGPDGSDSPFNYNGGFGSDTPGVSYKIRINPLTNSTTTTTISGASNGWSAYSDSTYGSNNNCWYHRNAKNPMLAGDKLVTITHREDVFTNGGAGWCWTSSSLVYFNKIGYMVDQSVQQSSVSSNSYLAAISDAAKAKNGDVSIVSGSGKFTSFDRNNQAWTNTGLTLTPTAGNSPSFTFTNGTIVDMILGQDDNMYSVSRTSDGFTIAKFDGFTWTSDWFSNPNVGGGKIAIDNKGESWVMWHFNNSGQIETFLTTTQSDTDQDGVFDVEDFCPEGFRHWQSTAATDHDEDGCRDMSAEWMSGFTVDTGVNDFSPTTDTDIFGNTAITGTFRGTVQFGATTLNSCSNTDDVFVAIKDRNGTWQWAKKFGSNVNNDVSGVIKFDTSGNLIVSATHGGGGNSALSFDSCNSSITGTHSLGSVLLKYNSSGSILWSSYSTRTGNNGGYTALHGLELDSSDSIYITGETSANANGPFFNNTTINCSSGLGGGKCVFVSKHNPNGSLEWLRHSERDTGSPNGYSEAKGTSIAVNATQLLIAGDFTGNNKFDGSGFSDSCASSGCKFDSNGGTDLFVLRMDKNGDIIQSISAGGSGDDHLTSAILTKDDNAFVGGHFDSTTLTLGPTNLTNTGGKDAFVAQFTTNNTWGWASKFNSSSDDEISSLTNHEDSLRFTSIWDSSSNVSIGGNSYSTPSSVQVKQSLYGTITYDGSFTDIQAIGTNSGDAEIYHIDSDFPGSTFVVGTFNSFSLTLGNLSFTLGASNFTHDELFLAHYLDEEDDDDDNDRIKDSVDSCPKGSVSWFSTNLTDFDNDGCQDSNEDLDDDNDGILDVDDFCPESASGNEVLDNGCIDSDKDGIGDAFDMCNQGVLGWTSTTINDHDGDGCLDDNMDFHSIHSISSTSTLSVNDIASMSTGAIVIVGSFTGVLSVGNHTLTSTSSSNTDGFVTLLNPNFTYSWVHKISSNVSSSIKTISIHDDDSISLGGTYKGTVTFGNQTRPEGCKLGNSLDPTSCNQDIFRARLSALGSIHSFNVSGGHGDDDIQQLIHTGNDSTTAVITATYRYTVPSNGGYVISGQYTTNKFLLMEHYNTTSFDWFHRNLHTISGGGNDFIRITDLIYDPSDSSFYLSGSYRDTIGYTSAILPSSSHKSYYAGEAFVSRINGTGFLTDTSYGSSPFCDWTWSSGSYSTYQGVSQPMSASTHSMILFENQLFLTGQFHSTFYHGGFSNTGSTFTPLATSFGQYNLTANNMHSGFIGGVNATSGVWDWVEKFNTSSYGFGGDYTKGGSIIESQRGLYLSGTYKDSARFGNVTLNSNHATTFQDRDLFFSHLDLNGTWMSTVNSTHTGTVSPFTNNGYYDSENIGYSVKKSISTFDGRRVHLVHNEADITPGIGNPTWSMGNLSTTNEWFLLFSFHSEDTDDDNDGAPDGFDTCSKGVVSWTRNSTSDLDDDGCHDASEDLNDDNDSILDVDDNCPLGATNWSSFQWNDYDTDGCFDSTEDIDDDDDSISDSVDDCYRGDLNWTSTNLTDHDTDGCRDSGSEDTDDDNDGLSDSTDLCSRGQLNWSSNSATDYDSDGCQDLGEDTDDDNDNVLDQQDSCSTGNLNWLSNTSTDYDTDGCQDSNEDLDDDNDSVLDDSDTCPKGVLNWSSTGLTDYDSDGCQDASQEDLDDDNDSVLDLDDSCSTGQLDWTSNSTADYDSDGCKDSSEDLDDDDDGILDLSDDCAKGLLNWTSSIITDHDSDGCHDSSEDFDDDNDGVLDALDDCSKGELNWNSNNITDYDLDGCKDASNEDLDDDNDSIIDTNDSCSKGDLNWTSSYTTDYDSDGCRDGSVEDTDDDNDSITDTSDTCPKGNLNWISSITTDRDSDGCRDATEDQNDDNDSFTDSNDTCPSGRLNWSSTTLNDFDFDGCHDSTEDLDDDNDSIFDGSDDCQKGDLNWTSTNLTDHDSDGCQDATAEDLDDDNDSVLDASDSCPQGDLNWTSSSITDYDSDGCQDSLEDIDDDSDTVVDIDDSCAKGNLNWTSTNLTDHDSDGCQDTTAEDLDDDNDSIFDGSDDCQKGDLNWTSTNLTDHDSDGCQDATAEDLDDDNDSVLDASDSCPQGDLNWTSSSITDYDSDGCQDSLEDIDDDSDTVVDIDDSCAKGNLNWTSTNLTDHDSDGCQDTTAEDLDDDNDSIFDGSDDCQKGDLNWTSTNLTDHDSDGCQDATAEDLDDDNDSVLDASDYCPKGVLNWISTNLSDIDGDGCRDFDEDFDKDNDGVEDQYDACNNGSMWWFSNSTSDHDSDGCQDSNEDLDDDNDTILDLQDSCSLGDLNWTSSSSTDYDSDGCQDSIEDLDDDDDLVSDSQDNCAKGDLNWLSNSTTDHDSDGCQDVGSEDLDDDNDLISDLLDSCPKGDLNWISLSLTDYDSDGCQDLIEDLDDDNDSVTDSSDFCVKGELNWTSSMFTDYDADGCRDLTEDLDDDNDSVLDSNDSCPKGELNWSSSNTTDHDSDGCKDSSTEDLDDDNDTVPDLTDSCPRGEIGWTSNTTTDWDGDGCFDGPASIFNIEEDTDDDNDGIEDTDDLCYRGAINWISNPTLDYDGDGCKDDIEDDDDDNDSMNDGLDDCQKGELNWTSSNITDYDFDGCKDDTLEDLDDDNDERNDSSDYCPKGELSWTSNSTSDYDSDGCKDNTSEDLDDDNDLILDLDDSCKRGELNWTSSQSTDYDADGCHDLTQEDLDDDNDNVSDLIDDCALGHLNWTSNPVTDHDSDGCFDSTEDFDDDNDGVLNTLDQCPTGDLAWYSTYDTDRDSDGCKDSSSEDIDDDNDGFIDDSDDCQFQFGNSTQDRRGCTDDDGDGYSNPDSNWTINLGADVFPSDSTQWRDTDYDSFGDNLFGFQGDSCPNTHGNSTIDRFGCIDSDGDGQSDQNDAFPSDPQRSSDLDGDGFDDALEDSCPQLYGTSSLDRKGCVDSDGDFWSDPTENWTSYDGADAFPSDSSQWLDLDSDGYGSNITGTTPDSCPEVYGTSTIDRFGCVDSDGDLVSDLSDECPLVWGNSSSDVLGCIDSDGDGLSDQNDAFPEDPTRGGDFDLDGYDNVIDDDCPLVGGNSTQDRVGCLDSDGDGYSDPDGNWSVLEGADSHIDNALQWTDLDGDGYGDNQNGVYFDSCPNQIGTSIIDRYGCIDSDGDGYSDPDLNWFQQDGADALPYESTQWNDIDGDGYGDNLLGVRPDSCPELFGNSTLDLFGCKDSDGDGLSDGGDFFPNDLDKMYDDDLDGYANVEDSCPFQKGSSFSDRLGCLDSDGDGRSNPGPNWTTSDGADAFPSDSTQQQDLDNDGFGDSEIGVRPDLCQGSASNIPVNDFGCSEHQLDTDSDGLSDAVDPCKNSGLNLCLYAAFGVGDSNVKYPALFLWSLISVGFILSLNIIYKKIRKTTAITLANESNATTSQASTEKCRNCNNQLVEGSEKCSNCGTRAKHSEVRETKVVGGLTGYEEETPTSLLSPIKKDSIVTKTGATYTIGEFLSDKGGMKMIYYASESQSEKVFVWKQASDHRGNPLELCNEKLEEEAVLSSEINHPNTSAVVAHGWTADGQNRKVKVVIEEFIEGQTLGQILEDNCKSSTPLEISTVIDWMKSLCSTLIDIYGTQGTIHRDLKPENIIISPESVPFIIDFGIAKELLVEHTQKTSLILLSGNWSAPERRDGISGPFSDVYSLGKILFAMVMNIPNSKAEIFIQDKEEISAALGGKYPQVADLIIDSCNANYRDRIESIDEMLSVLEHLD